MFKGCGFESHCISPAGLMCHNHAPTCLETESILAPHMTASPLRYCNLSASKLMRQPCNFTCKQISTMTCDIDRGDNSNLSQSTATTREEEIVTAVSSPVTHKRCAKTSAGVSNFNTIHWLNDMIRGRTLLIMRQE